MPTPRHPRPGGGAALTLALLLAASLTLPAAAEGQERDLPDRPDRPRTLEIGARLGLESVNNSLLFGAHARLPVDPWLRIELMPGAWVTPFESITEYQLDADAVLMLDSRGAFYIGGGAAFRNTIYDVEEGEDGELLGEREFRTGYNLIAGLRTPPDRDGGIATQLELRWISVDTFDLQTLTLGVNWPLVVF